MTDRPILFSAPMIRALMAGTKTQTRRLAWRCPCKKGAPKHVCGAGGYAGWKPLAWQSALPGDRLLVREQWSPEFRWNGTKPRDIGAGFSAIWYWADGSPEDGDWTRPKPSIHMPRWVSRLTLVLTEVRKQRLQDITEDDALAEGIYRRREFSHWSPAPNGGKHTAATSYAYYQEPPDFPAPEFQRVTTNYHNRKFTTSYPCARDAYAALWDTINGAGSWFANPEVVALTFEVHRDNIDHMKGLP